jgi:hypothetical protein
MMKRKRRRKKKMGKKSTEEALEGGSLEKVVEAGVVVGQSHQKGLVHLQLHDEVPSGGGARGKQRKRVVSVGQVEEGE